MAFSDTINGLSNINKTLKDANINKTLKDANANLTNANPSQTTGKLNKINTQIVGITKTSTGIVNNVTNVGRTVASVAKKLGFDKFSEALTGKDSMEFIPKEDDVKKDERNGELTGLKGFYDKFSGKSIYGSNNIDT